MRRSDGAAKPRRRNRAPAGEVEPPPATAADGTVRRAVTIANSRGLHARAAARFVKVAAQFDATVTVVRNDMEVSGLSIMGLMMLAAGLGAEIELRARGREAAPVIAALVDLIADKFEEE